MMSFLLSSARLLIPAAGQIPLPHRAREKGKSSQHQHYCNKQPPSMEPRERKEPQAAKEAAVRPKVPKERYNRKDYVSSYRTNQWPAYPQRPSHHGHYHTYHWQNTMNNQVQPTLNSKPAKINKIKAKTVQRKEQQQQQQQQATGENTSTDLRALFGTALVERTNADLGGLLQIPELEFNRLLSEKEEKVLALEKEKVALSSEVELLKEQLKLQAEANRSCAAEVFKALDKEWEASRKVRELQETVKALTEKPTEAGTTFHGTLSWASTMEAEEANVQMELAQMKEREAALQIEQLQEVVKAQKEEMTKAETRYAIVIEETKNKMALAEEKERAAILQIEQLQEAVKTEAAKRNEAETRLSMEVQHMVTKMALAEDEQREAAQQITELQEVVKAQTARITEAETRFAMEAEEASSIRMALAEAKHSLQCSQHQWEEDMSRLMVEQAQAASITNQLIQTQKDLDAERHQWQEERSSLLESLSTVNQALDNKDKAARVHQDELLERLENIQSQLEKRQNNTSFKRRFLRLFRRAERSDA